MTDKVLITVPEDFDDPDAEIDLVAYFRDLLDSDLEPALDTDVWELDQRAQFIEAEVTDVSTEADGIVVSYDVTFDAYYGCRDQNYAGTDDRHIVGTRVGDSWVFDKHSRAFRATPWTSFRTPHPAFEQLAVRPSKRRADGNGYF